MLKRIVVFVIVAIVGSIGLEAKSAHITNIEITGVSDSEKLMEVIGLKKGDVYSPRKIENAKRAIIKSMEGSGYYGTTVETSVKPVNDSVAITFDVNRGEKIKIEKVTFVGNEKVKSSALEANLANKEGGILGFLPGFSDGTAMPEQLPYDQLRVREAYLERGYLDAKVGEPLMKVDFSSYKAEVTYVVKEGEQYTVSSVSVKGKVEGLDKNELMEELKMKSGKVFDVRKLRKDLKKVKETVGDLGYAFAQIKPVFKKNTKNHTVDITYTVNPGKKVYINDVIISGNEKTMDYVVRRYIYLAPGDLFKYTDLEESKKELQRTGFFEKVVVKPQRVSANKINLVVEVEETQTGSISGGIGYGSYEGFTIGGSVSDKNLFGSGIAGSLGLDYSNKSHNYSLSFTDPRIFNTLYSLSFGIYDSSYEYEYDTGEDYTVDRTGGWFSVGKRIGLHTSASIGYSYTDVDYHDYTFIPAYPEAYESYTKSSIIGSVVFDNTDDYYVPREGIYAKLNLEYAGVGGDADFWRAEMRFAAYYGLEDMIDYDLILRYKLHAGYIDDGGYTPIAEMFMLGGSRYGIRGFAGGSLSPYYMSGTTKVRVGADQIVVNSIEASIPLDMITKGMRLTGFVDYGMMKNTIYKANKIQRGWLDRSSVGAQVEWKSPFGPINLVFAYPINDKAGDDTAAFEFTMGSRF